MAGSTWGTIFRIMTWGESHGKGVGVTIDGCPAGLPLCEEDIQRYLDRRKPGQSRYTTARQESDQVEILSGVFEGKTTGTPIAMMVCNTDQRSKDYSAIQDIYRPGHADYGFDQKYGFRDYRGGGRSSARETTARSRGSENNDAFYTDGDGTVKKRTNHAGGILGGISDGSEIVLRAAFKPTPSIARTQQTVNRNGENVEIAIHGRHDPVVVPRAVVVVEAMTALTVLDLFLTAKNARV